MSAICIIPARYGSSRFPGKSLAMIGNKPMIAWTYDAAICVLEAVVATDDERIAQVCSRLGISFSMTSTEHKTGTDRIAEVAAKCNDDIIINLQGDDPFIKPESIEAVLSFMENNPSTPVVNCIAKITNPFEVVCATVPKVVINKYGEAVFLSRAPIPYPQSRNPIYYKQVCVYGFRKSALLKFASWARGPLEQCEDIELLRFIENHVTVKMLEVEGSSFAIDTPKDLERANQFVKERKVA